MPQQPQTSLHIHWSKLFHQFHPISSTFSGAQSSLTHTYCTSFCRGKLVVLLLDLKATFGDTKALGSVRKRGPGCAGGIRTWNRQQSRSPARGSSFACASEMRWFIPPKGNLEMHPWNLLKKEILFWKSSFSDSILNFGGVRCINDFNASWYGLGAASWLRNMLQVASFSASLETEASSRQASSFNSMCQVNDTLAIKSYKLLYCNSTNYIQISNMQLNQQNNMYKSL